MSRSAVEGTTLEGQEGVRGQSQELKEKSASGYTHSANQNEREGQDELSEEWEIMARAWLCSFPDAKAVTLDEVETWIDSNYGSLPEGIRSMPRPDLCHRLIAIQNCMRLPDQNQEGNQLDLHHARFQRTDQWIPVYAWLESLDKEEVVKSKDISDWLTENPKVQDQLCSRHSRYHLMHYIKKCHLKILKRREKKKGIEQSEQDSSLKVHKTVPMKQPMPSVQFTSTGSSVGNLPKDSDLYLAKRNEAYHKYELLVELEKLLSQSSSHPKATCEAS